MRNTSAIQSTLATCGVSSPIQDPAADIGSTALRGQAPEYVGDSQARI